MCGHGFTEPMDAYSRLQKLMLKADIHWTGFIGASLTSELTYYALKNLVNNLYLFIPLLTMGVINREVNSGSMKLLYSSPIRTRDIVLGKYLGLVVFVVILILMTSLFLISATLIIKDPEIYRHFASLLGVFLMTNAYIAIGLFLSCVTNYQIVAGVLTFVVFFILGSISSLWQQFDLLRDITYFLSISGRTENFINGLISTRDLFYFILITVLFLGFALIKLKSTQESKSWTVSFTRYITFSMIILFLGYITSRPGQVAYWDLTRNKMNTIHPDTQSVLKEMDGSPLTVTLYTNLFSRNVGYGLPQNRNFYTWRIWELYRRFYPHMNFNFVYYYDLEDGDSSLYKTHPKKNIHQIAEKFCKQYGIRKSIFLTPDEIRKKIDLRNEREFIVMQLEYKGKKTWLRTYADKEIWPGQSNVSGSIRRLVRDSIPKILFTSGHFERSPYKTGERHYGALVVATSNRNSLINQGVDADTISLLSSQIPVTTSGLVVADPRSQMQPIEQDKIKTFIQNGGNAIILAEVKKQQMLNPVLNSMGVNADNGTIVRPNEHEMPHILSDANLTQEGGYLAKEQMMYLYQIKVLDTLKTPIEGGVNISYRETNGFSIKPIVEFAGNKNTWIENGILVVDSASPKFSASEGDIQLDKYTLGVKLTRTVNNKEQRIIITGDADMLGPVRNQTGTAFYSWILYNEYPVYYYYPLTTDTYLTAGEGTVKKIRWVYLYVIPILLLVLSVIVLVRRKRK